MELKERVRISILDSISTILKLNEYSDGIICIAKEISDAFTRGNKLILFGNGGSAADAQHIATEFVSRFKKERPALPAMALTTNTSALTAIANDYEFRKVFERQVEAFVKEGDVVIGITTSGDSMNVADGLSKAAYLGALTIGFTGSKSAFIDSLCNYMIKIGTDTPRIQEAHITVGHIICELVEEILYGTEQK